MAFGTPNISNPFNKVNGGGVTNVSTRDLSPAEPVKMAIIPVAEPYNSINTLLLNTNSITESKSANWVKHYVPGQSDPLLQWISGTEKTLTFTAMVTKDLATNPTVTEAKNADVWSLVVNPELYERYANADDVPGSVLKSIVNLDTGAVTITPVSKPYWSRSIQRELDFYRSLVVPREGTSASLSKTPPLVYLRMGTILGDRAHVESQKFILLNYNLTVTEFSPELEPTKAMVTFTFVEYVAKNKTSKAQAPESNIEFNKAKKENNGIKRPTKDEINSKYQYTNAVNTSNTPQNTNAV